MKILKIKLLFSPGCSSQRILPELVREALEELGISSYELSSAVIKSWEEAQRFRFYGSPTIKVNDQDLEPGAEGGKKISLG